MLINDIDSYFKSNFIAPVILIYGAEEFLIDEALEKSLSYLVKKDDAFDFDNLDAENTGLDKIIDICLSYPFVSEKRVVVVRGIQKLFTSKINRKSEDKQPFYKYLTSPQPSTILIMTGNVEALDGIYKSQNSGRRNQNN